MISATAIGAAGRLVRCAKCSHQWHAIPQQTEASSEPESYSFSPHEGESSYSHTETEFSEELAAAELSSPSLRRKSPPPLPSTSLWQVSSAFLLLCCALLMVIALRESLQPSLTGIYRQIGYYPESGIALADVTLKQLPTRRNPRYEVHCHIVNQAKETRMIPRLSMQLLNEGGDALAEDDNFLMTTGMHLRTGKSLPCQGLRFEVPSTTAHHLIIDFGSPLDLFLRSAWEQPAADEKPDEESPSPAAPQVAPQKEASHG
jgi:hypothetical protein